jgi:hypothetical protein
LELIMEGIDEMELDFKKAQFHDKNSANS